MRLPTYTVHDATSASTTGRDHFRSEPLSPERWGTFSRSEIAMPEEVSRLAITPDLQLDRANSSIIKMAVAFKSAALKSAARSSVSKVLTCAACRSCLCPSLYYGALDSLLCCRLCLGLVLMNRVIAISLQSVACSFSD